MTIAIAKQLLALGTVLLLGGCGTVTTVLRDDGVAIRELKARKTYCDTVPRVYSGVAYDLCMLHAPPNSAGGLALSGIPWAFIDVPVSAVLDTLVLPYTLYRQNTEGGLQLR